MFPFNANSKINKIYIIFHYITIDNYITNYFILLINKNRLYIYIYSQNPYQQKVQNKNMKSKIAFLKIFATVLLVT